MADPKILLFTDQFPFGNYEQFLETEIIELAKYSDEITVVPTKTGSKQRPLPSNVTLDTGLADRIKGNLFSKTIWLCTHLIPAVRTLYDYKKYFLKGDATRRVLRFVYNCYQSKSWIMSRYSGPIDRAILYTYWFGANTFGIAQWARDQPYISVVSRTHRHDLYEEENYPAFIPFRKETIDLMDSIYFVSKHGLYYLMEKYPFGLPKYHFAPLGVRDPGFICPASDDGVWRILSCSTIREVKQLDLLLESLFLLATKRPGKAMAWYHIGSGPGKSKLEQVIKKSSPSNLSCTFLGQLENREVLKFYCDQPIDIFINVSRSEGLPVSIMEAQSCGIPVMATAVGGIPEIVNDQNGVLLSSQPNKLEIADALSKYFLEEAAQKRSASWASWKKGYNGSENYRDFYQMLVS